MAESILSVEIGAQLTQLNTQFAKAATIVQNGATAITASTDLVERNFTLLNRTNFTFGANFQRAATQATSASAVLAQQATRSAAVLGGATVVGANQAAFALTNLGRVAQDAPFGFIGIQNNLNPLLESFQRLRAETGSNAGALRALGSQLIGPAGLGIALSLVGAGILLYQKYTRDSTKAVKDATDQNEEYIKSLGDIRKASLQGEINAQKELTTLGLLYKRSQDVNVPQKERYKTIDDLQKLYPQYFDNLSNEAILAGKGAEAYNKLSGAIIATAKAEAGQALISEKQQQILINNQKIADATLDRNQKIVKSLEAQKAISAGGAGTGAAGFASISEGQRNAAIKAQETINSLRTDNIKLQNESLNIEKQINIQIDKGARLTGSVSDGLPKTAKLLRPDQLDPSKLIATAELGDTITKNFLTAGNSVDGAGIKFNKFLSTAELFRDQINDLLGSSFIVGFENIGTAIGNALATGGNVLEAFGQSVLSTIGDVLVQFGKLTIAAGVASTALGKALANPLLPGAGLAAIAAGVALVAVGSLVKGFSGNVGGGNSGSGVKSSNRIIPGFANGTNYAPGGLALVGERGPELVNLPTGSKVIPNHGLAGLGGNGDIIINGNLAIAGDQIKFLIDKVTKRQKQFG